jgi:S1-C subfamily serine protease
VRVRGTQVNVDRQLRRRGLRPVAYALALWAMTPTSHAAEGFFADKLPPAVRAAWPSVYAFVCEGRKGRYVASAFLVKKAARGAQADYFFITAGHAVDDCRQATRYLAEDMNQPRFESDGITLAAPPPRFADMQTVYVDDAYDVAVVRVTAAASARVGAPIKVSDGCNRALHRQVYAVGFPGVGQRKSLRVARETKRWSQGEYVGLGRAEFRGATSIYIAATVDSLPGSSGGPVVDENGQLIGVMAKGAAAPENGFRYDVDPHKADDWQSFLVPCQAVVGILQRSGLN